MNIQTGVVTVVPNPTKSRNCFGPLSEIAGKTLKVIERNEQGDCLSLFESANHGQQLIDVDHEDVAAFTADPNHDSITDILVTLMKERGI